MSRNDRAAKAVRLMGNVLIRCRGLALGFTLLAAAQAAEPRDPARWEPDIQAFEAGDRAEPPPRGAVLFAGSSSIRYWTNLAESFPRWTVIRRGFGGSHLPDLMAFADRIILPYRPAQVVIYAGENDLARGDSPREVSGAFRRLARRLERELPEAQIWFISMKPSPSRWHLSPQLREGNRLIQEYCADRKRLHFVDVWSAMLDGNGQPERALFDADNLHLNAQGYALWAEIIGRAMEMK